MSTQGQRVYCNGKDENCGQMPRFLPSFSRERAEDIAYHEYYENQFGGKGYIQKHMSSQRL